MSAEDSRMLDTVQGRLVNSHYLVSVYLSSLSILFFLAFYHFCMCSDIDPAAMFTRTTYSTKVKASTEVTPSSGSFYSHYETNCVVFVEWVPEYTLP